MEEKSLYFKSETSLWSCERFDESRSTVVDDGHGHECKRAQPSHAGVKLYNPSFRVQKTAKPPHGFWFGPWSGLTIGNPEDERPSSRGKIRDLNLSNLCVDRDDHS